MNRRTVLRARLPIIRSALLVGGLVCLALGVAYADQSDPSTTGAVEALLATDNAWADAARAGDKERIVSFWADDVVNYFPGRPKVVGKEACRRLVETSRAQPGFSLHWVPTSAAVAQSGELGYTHGTFEMSVAGPDGKPLARNGYYVCIWKRQQDGAWKCIVEISSFRGAEAEPAARK